MIEDIRLAVEGQTPVAFYGKFGGIVPSVDDIVEETKKLIK